MKNITCSGFIAGAMFSALIAYGATTLSAQEGKKDDKAAKFQEEMAAAMKKAAKYTEPGPHHKKLERFLGSWDVEMQFFMGGSTMPGKPDKLTTEVSWLMKDRYIKFETTGTMMGKPIQMFNITGYDNFRQSYTSTTMSTADTAMLHFEGDMDPSDKALIGYGTLDEYLDGQIAKMVKYVWRFESDDKMVLEVHDLPIGENNTKVFEMRYTRKK